MFIAVEVPAALSIAIITGFLLMSYYSVSTGERVLIIGVACASTTLAVLWALMRGEPYFDAVLSWQEADDPTQAVAIAAWDGATNFPMRSFRANALCVNLLAIIPVVLVAELKLHLSLGASLVLFCACIVPAGYGTILNYFIAETLMRPLITEIAGQLPEDFPFAANGLPIRIRLKLLLPVFTSFVGFVVAALMVGHGGTSQLGKSVAASVVVGLVFSFELTQVLARSLTRPISDLRRGLTRVTSGDYDVRAPVITSDELGELSHDFNQMAKGLAEREAIREAFGTYLDADIVPLILGGQYPTEGVEVTVSIMFVDVLGFTSFAEQASAPEVVASLNSLFETMVPIVTAHGGHVDKFMGDGMLAVFGAPEGFADHADRAVAAGLEIVSAVNGRGSELQVGVGINTGTVVAGSIGGAGRLNFSVIGDAVNVAARVEAATRTTGDSLLFTCATRDAMQRPVQVHSRGSVPLKGKAEPVEVLACGVPAALRAV
jgi:class 3 adenylate cyclase